MVYCSAACAESGAADHAAECGVLAAVRARGDARLLSGVRGLRLFIRLLHRAAVRGVGVGLRFGFGLGVGVGVGMGGGIRVGVQVSVRVDPEPHPRP